MGDCTTIAPILDIQLADKVGLISQGAWLSSDVRLLLLVPGQNELLQKNQRWVWYKECEKVMETAMKMLLTSNLL